MREDEQLSLREAADALGISEVSARRWVKSGKLKAAQPGRKYLIPRGAVEELLRPKAVAAPPLEEREAAGGRIVTVGASLKGTGTLDVGEGFVLIGERRLAQIIERTTRGELSANEAMAAALGKAETT